MHVDFLFTDCTSFRNDAIDIKSDKTNNSTHLYHSMFYNHKSKRVEANISWEHAMGKRLPI